MLERADDDLRRVETREEWGHALTGLRLRAGLTVRELARRCGLSSATAGGWVKGTHLPGPAQRDQFRTLLAACGVPGENVPAWEEALDRVRERTDGRQGRRGPATSPYRGLEPFEAEDAGLFFGREDFVDEILDRLADLRGNGPDERLLFLIGASGSGKSSLLRAGVQPAVLDCAWDGEPWSVAIMVPGPDPLTALNRTLEGATEPRLLIVDQFEELYTLAAGQASGFVAALTGLGPRTLIVAGLRADFFAAAAADPRLLPALQERQMVVPPLAGEQVRAAIVGPAEACDVRVDEALVEVVLADVLPGHLPVARTGQQHVLPLLSHALLAAWRRRVRGRLTLPHYREAGGLRGAVQQSAEQAYADLDPAGKELARRLFLRLVTVDDDVITTKRRITLDELPAGREQMRPVLERFVAQRLITAHEQHVEISHDALLTAWPRLAEWIVADHAGLLVHRRLTRAAEDWRAGGSDPQGLLRGNLLIQVGEWARDPDHRAAMNAAERDFLDRSVDAEEAGRLAARRRVRVLRRLVAALMAVVVVAVGLAGYAFRAGSIAADQRKAADRARDEALSRQVAIESDRTRAVDPALAGQLALAAYRISPTLDARSALLDATAAGVVHRLIGTSGPTVLRIDPGGTVMAVSSAGDGSVNLFRYAGGRPGERLGVIPAAEPGKVVFALAFTPDGDTLAVGGEGGRVHLHDVRDPARPLGLGAAPGTFGEAVLSLAFDPGGTRLVAGGGEPSLRAWQITPGTGWRAPAEVTISGGQGAVQAVAYRPDGGGLAAAGTAGTVQLWPAARLGDAPAEIPLGTTTVTALAWPPSGDALLAGAKDGTAAILDTTRHEIRRRLETGFTSWVHAAAYAPGGDLVAVGGSNNTMAVFDVHTGARLDSVASAAQITSVGYSPDGGVLHMAAADGVVRSSPARRRLIDTGAGPLFALGVDRSGTRIAVSSSGADGHVQLWGMHAGTPRRLPSAANPVAFGPSAGSAAISPDGGLVVTGNREGVVLLNGRTTLSGSAKLVEALQFSPDGRLVAAAADDERVHLWDVSDPSSPRTLPDLDTGGLTANVAFSPDGRLLAAASVDRFVHLWDISDPRAPVALPSLGGFDNYAWSVAFSPDSRTVAAGGADDTIRLWDLTDPRAARQLGRPITGPTHYVYSLAFRPDGRELAASGGDGSVWTWNVGTPAAPLVTGTLHAANPGGKTYAIAYLPDGATLAATGTSGRVTFWDTDETRMADALCSGGGDPLTVAEWAKYLPGSAYRRTCP
ncbi:helix-turn-helix domain-containing protein [Actinoplanes sp. NPDC023714]|uniref:nSTAND1 domain-containing NTPase n=1 Tax=Actinoplanes sp. NPDC023714 TaxID=3154322 RepID=UPI0033D20281